MLATKPLKNVLLIGLKVYEPSLTRRNTQSKSAVYSNKRQDRKAIAPFSQKSLQSKSFCDTPYSYCRFERSREIP